MATTKHNHRPNFGRYVDGCPRCIELAEGEPPREAGHREPSPGTKHNHELVYGRREAGCPRCAELDAGAEPRRPDWVERLGQRKRDDEQLAREIRAHFAPGHEHRCPAGRTGVCTFGDW